MISKTLHMWEPLCVGVLVVVLVSHVSQEVKVGMTLGWRALSKVRKAANHMLFLLCTRMLRLSTRPLLFTSSKNQECSDSDSLWFLVVRWFFAVYRVTEQEDISIRPTWLVAQYFCVSEFWKCIMDSWSDYTTSWHLTTMLQCDFVTFSTWF